jgi:AcrR family transcriptional regulator
MKNFKKAKNLQPQENVGRILNQAIRSFLEKGYHGTSIGDITQAA